MPKTVSTPGKISAVMGKGKAKAIANPDSGPDHSDDSDEGFQSFHMANGTANGYGAKGKGKGKGKARVATLDGFVDSEEEDLYS